MRNKKDVLAMAELEHNGSDIVYSCSNKMTSHIKAAAAAGVQMFYVDSVPEMEKIKKLNPMARCV